MVLVSSHACTHSPRYLLPSYPITLSRSDPFTSSPQQPFIVRLGSSKRLRWLFWTAVVVSLIIGMTYTAFAAWKDLQELQSSENRWIQWGAVDFTWLSLAGVLYLIGQLPCGFFWHRVLIAMGQRPRLVETMRAYFIGHLGKYVPGKAMVVVMRAGLIHSDRVDPTIAAVSVFVETLTQMAAGAAVAAAILVFQFRDQTGLLIASLSLFLFAGIPTLPPIARWLVRLVKVTKAKPEAEESLRGLSFRVLLAGWCGIAVGWIVLGLSLWAVLRGLPLEAARTAELSNWPLWTVAVALAIILGFVSLIPGGLGVRELVLIPLLAKVAGLGTFVALISAVVLRLVWLLAELILSGLLYFPIAGSLKNGVGWPDKPKRE